MNNDEIMREVFEQNFEEFVRELKERLMFKHDNDGSSYCDLLDEFNKQMFDKIDTLAEKYLNSPQNDILPHHK